MLVVGEGEVVAAQHVGAALQVADDGVERVLRLLVLLEVALHRLADAGDEGQRARQTFAAQLLAGGVEVLHLVAQRDERLRHRAALVALVGELADRRLQHLAAPRGLALQLDAHGVDRLTLAVELGFAGGERVAHEGVGGGGESGIFGRFCGLERDRFARDVFDRGQ